MRVLILEDDAFAQNLLLRQLTALEITDVVIARDGLQALELMANQAVAFDALLIDLNMPQMDGVEFLRHLVGTRFQGGLVLVSGEDERILQSVGSLAREHGLHLLGSLSKPVALPQLKEVLERLEAGNRRPKDVATVVVDETELATAMAEGQIVNDYQPQVYLATGELAGVEALARWRHPRHGLVMPAHFVPVAEARGLSGQLAFAVLSRALLDARHWMQAGLDLRLSVNVSVDTLEALAFPDEVARMAGEAGLAIDRLVLEVTESQLTSDPRVLLDIASRLRLKRIGLSIDDFGTGYSSLVQLRDVPFDELKLDGSFVQGASRDSELRAIVEANVGLARGFAIRSVAEGVEERGDWELLRRLGCDLAQGYLIGRPMSAERIAGWAVEWRGRSRDLLREGA
jgi:EAL domain-containing protein (putative c-di-GMP-specific phosphodiesterase class I)/ActR/RegA family two-component response regulator